MTPYQLAEAQRLHAKGLKLVELYPDSKRPVGDGWNIGGGVSEVKELAGGYGLLLAANGMCSIDPDDVDLSEIGFWRCGFDLDNIRDAGVATSSTRPGSGGRVAFKVPQGSGLKWIKFSSKAHGTICELRAASANLQDTLPGTVYYTQDGAGPFVQEYAGLFTLDTAPTLPDDLLAWWQRMSDDVDYQRAQQALFVGEGAQLSVSSGTGQLAYGSPHRAAFNDSHNMTDILEAHGYTKHRNGRYAPTTATGAASVRLIPGHADLWQSDHASDPLWGTFDTWTAHVVLDHGGDLESAEKAAEKNRVVLAVEGFDDNPVTQIEGTGGLVEADDTLPNFDRDKAGKIKPILNNLIAAIPREDVIGCRIGIDTFRDELVMSADGGNSWRPFVDTDYTWIRARLETGMNGFAPLQKETVKDAVRAVAEKQKFDSAQVWLNGIEWDGVRRVDSFYVDYFGVDDTPYHRAVAAYTWTALAGRVMEPGCKADMCPIFSGTQGTKKTSTVMALVPDEMFYAEISFNDSEDNLARKMRGKLVGEIAELDGMHTKAIEGIKAHLSRRIESWVPKYQEFTTSYHRRAIFFGSTNDTEILGDKTGNRRFLPMTVGVINVEGIRSVCAQLWAEGRELFKIGGVQWNEAETLARQVHQHFEFSDSWKEPVSEWLNGVDFDDVPNSECSVLTTSDVLIGALNFEAKAILRRDEIRVGYVMRDLGYKKVRKRIKGVLTYSYVPEI